MAKFWWVSSHLRYSESQYAAHACRVACVVATWLPPDVSVLLKYSPGHTARTPYARLRIFYVPTLFVLMDVVDSSLLK